MSIPNDATTVPTNGRTASSSGKKKTSRKASSRSSSSKPVPVRHTGPIEILFTQEPTPHREPQPPYIWIDFPTQSENLTSPTYVIRLGVGGADLVEISIDKGPWVPCRLTSGYWWYDWAAIAPGSHTMAARMRTPDGRWFKTPIRQCDYRAE